MEKGLRTRFDKLEKKRLALFADLDSLDTAVLRQQPAEGKWSIIQVMEHLMIAEDASMKYVQKKLSYPDKLISPGFKSTLKYTALVMALRSPLRFKAPGIVSEVPNERNLPQIKTKWNDLRQEMQTALNSIPKEHLDKDLFKHPFAGKMSLYRGLNFMNLHLDHHLKQVKRIRKQIGA